MAKPKSNTGKSKILVVEDEESIRTILAMGLRKSGFDVVEASDAMRAVDLIRNDRVGTVLLDLMMPQADGTDVLGFLRSLKKDAPRIIVITNLSEDEALEKIGDFKVDAIMTKASSSLQQIIDAAAGHATKGSRKKGV
jgi:DNA-binding response OmpR family regulator